LGVLNRAFGHTLALEERASMPFAGGIRQYGYQCGMIWGAALAARTQAYRLVGSGPQAETKAMTAAQRLVESFHNFNNHINCSEITGLNKSFSMMQMVLFFLIKGGGIGCFRMTVGYARKAFKELGAIFAEDNTDTLSAPVSCSALLAKKMGVSDMHTIMAAGFAGGIGLCGGACGALGAAIWIIGMSFCKERDVDNLWKDKAFNSKVDDLMNRFLKKSNYEFECSEIVG
jgi:hypothetical protein